jgi:glycosyltransferase involved in cell wall biosynthesis
MSAGPANVALVANGLTLGGTEKGLVTHALSFDRSRFEPRVICVRELGPRTAGLEAAEIPVSCAGGDRHRLAELLSGADVVHAWRPGAGDQTVPLAAREAGARVLVETNVFGLLDPSPEARRFDCRLFLSRTCALRYRRRIGAGIEAFHRRNRVLPLPLDADRLRAAAPQPVEARRRLGLDPGRPVVGRIGRADDLKWRNLLVDMLPQLLHLAPDVQLLLVGVTPKKRRRLRRRGVLERCLLHDPVPDERALAALYAACDVLVAGAELGESQGLALAEAMALEIPVVTCSTPWVDNAQIEYVEHGLTGYVANHPQPFAEAVAALLGDPEGRRAFGSRARSKVDGMLDPSRLTRRLEELYQDLLDGHSPPARWNPGPAELEAFEAEYGERARAEFRPLRLRERAEARAARERERLRRVSGLLRPRMLPLASAMLRARMGELRRPRSAGTQSQVSP